MFRNYVVFILVYQYDTIITLSVTAKACVICMGTGSVPYVTSFQMLYTLKFLHSGESNAVWEAPAHVYKFARSLLQRKGCFNCSIFWCIEWRSCNKTEESRLNSLFCICPPSLYGLVNCNKCYSTLFVFTNLWILSL